jgi:hypothetical protein
VDFEKPPLPALAIHPSFTSSDVALLTLIICVLHLSEIASRVGHTTRLPCPENENKAPSTRICSSVSLLSTHTSFGIAVKDFVFIV